MGRREQSLRRVVLPLAALAALFLGAVSASGHTTSTDTVTIEVFGVGTVKSDPSGINCGNGNTKCFAAFTDGPVTLTAKSGSGSMPVTWGDDCPGLGSGNECDLTVSPGGSVGTATFDPKAGTSQSTLTVTYSDDGFDASGDEGVVSSPDGEVDCGQTVNPDPSPPPDFDPNTADTQCTWVVLTGSTLTLFQTPDPNAGDVFAGWGGACTGKDASCTVSMSDDQQIAATWAPAGSTTQLTVNVTGDGSVSGGGIDCPTKCVASEKLNSAVTLTANPGDGQIFTGWGSGGDCTGTSPTCTVTMNGDSDVTAIFAAANTLTVNVVGVGNVSGGSGAINCGLGANICSANFATNSTVTLVAGIGTGATFTGWTGACGGTATTCTVSMNQAKSVTATFTGGTTGSTGFGLSVAVSGNGTVTGSGINCGNGATACSSTGHAVNSTLTLTATPSAGATFAGWGGGSCTGTTSTCTLTFTSAKTVTASFTGGTSTVGLTVSVSGPGTVTGSGISCGNGSSSCTSNVAAGTSLTLTETPATGAKFAGWGGSCAGTSTTCTVSLTSSKSVSATFETAGTPGTLTLAVGGKGSVSTSAGACAATGPSKTCVQHFKAGASVVLTARPAAGQSFLGWSGACTGTKPTCTVKLTAAESVTASFSAKTTPPPRKAALAALGVPRVRKTSTGYDVTLRFTTTLSGVAHVSGLRAGRNVVPLSLRVGAGRATIGPFPVKLPGFYTFEIRLGGRVLRMTACLGTCGAAHKGDPFLLTREPPVVTKTGDVWSVSLHARSTQISDARIRAYRGAKLLVNQHFLGRATRIILGPFLLGPGNYTLKLTATDAYGRTRTLIWIVSLGT